MAKKSFPPSVIEWTHVADVTPENSDHILVIDRGEVKVAFVWSGRFQDSSDRKITPTHWAYLPRV